MMISVPKRLTGPGPGPFLLTGFKTEKYKWSGLEDWTEISVRSPRPNRSYSYRSFFELRQSPVWDEFINLGDKGKQCLKCNKIFKH